MRNGESRDVSEQIAILEGLLMKFLKNLAQVYKAGGMKRYTDDFKRLFLEAVRKLPSDRGSAMRSLYLRAKDAADAFYKEVNDEALIEDEYTEVLDEETVSSIMVERQIEASKRKFDDGLYPETFTWLSDEQMDEWRMLLEEQGILIIN